MKNLKHLAIASIILFATVTCGVAKPKVLVFSKTAKFHHESIAVGIPAIIKLGQENNFDVDTTTNAENFTVDNLKQYAAVIFLSTTGDVLNAKQQTAFEQYIKTGGGFMGVHAATDTEYDWPWYGKLVGAYFKSHPSRQQRANLQVIDRNFGATKHLPAVWRRLDEWYNYKWISPDIKVIIKIDEHSYSGGDNDGNHPMSWYHAYDGGRAFYTALGHTDESYADPLFLKHLLGGIQYAIGTKL